MPTTTFLLTRIQRLRKQAAEAARSDVEPPQGWSKSIVDPMNVLAVFSPLRIKKGFVLRAYQFTEGGNGNAFVWAMSIDAPSYEPEECPKLEDQFLSPPKPPAALNDVMEAIDGDGTPWSYMCASLFCREISEFGAMWHGCSWGTHTILGRNPIDPWKPMRGDRQDRPSGGPAKWTWIEREPADWRPRAADDDMGSKTVVFFTFSGLGQEMIHRHTDKYSHGSYCFEADCHEIAMGPGGYVY